MNNQYPLELSVTLRPAQEAGAQQTKSFLFHGHINSDIFETIKSCLKLQGFLLAETVTLRKKVKDPNGGFTEIEGLFTIDSILRELEKVKDFGIPNCFNLSSSLNVKFTRTYEPAKTIGYQGQPLPPDFSRVNTLLSEFSLGEDLKTIIHVIKNGCSFKLEGVYRDDRSLRILYTIFS